MINGPGKMEYYIYFSISAATVSEKVLNNAFQGRGEVAGKYVKYLQSCTHNALC
jgi:hypothetical protein